MTVLERIQDYLGNGGLFNPEAMDHDKVRDLILACRDEIRGHKDEIRMLQDKAQSNWDILETVAIGEKLECSACGKFHPCLCDK